jgi:hypothetical protein
MSTNAVLADESVMYAVSFSAALVAVLAVSTIAALDGVSAISAVSANAALVGAFALSANAAQWYPRHCTCSLPHREVHEIKRMYLASRTYG